MKKYIYWDLFHLSLVLSLLRLYPNLYRGVSWDSEPFGHEVFLGDSTAYAQARFHNLHNNRLNAFIHPKNLDDSIERSLFIHDINSLYRPGWNYNPPRRETNIFAYIVNELQPQSVASTAQENQESETSESQSEVTASELTQADMDLIEILWKQDIDMGIAREVYDGTWKKPKEAATKLEEEPSVSSSSTSYSNPWQGLNYSIDSETGEHIALPTNDSTNNAAALVPNNYLDITLEEALSLFEADSLQDVSKANETFQTEDFDDQKSVDANLLTTEDYLLGTDLSYTESDVPVRTLLEQLQDLQELVSEAEAEPFPHSYSSVYSDYGDMSSNYNSTENNNAILDALLQNTTLALPMNETLLNTSYSSHNDGFDMEHDTSINTLLSFLTNDTDPNPVGAVGGEDQNDICPDLPMANLTTDNSFLSQLMNEGSMDFTDFCDLPMNTNTSQIDWPASTSSDSAVSSMGSDWSDSCSGESSNDGSSAWNPSKIGFGIKSEELSTLESDHDSIKKSTLPSPKKHHLFGKQQPFKKKENVPFISEEESQRTSFPASPDEEYEGPSRTEPLGDLPHMGFIHNHTYHYVGDAVPDKDASQKPLERDKPKSSLTGSVRGTRDEKRLRKNNLPLSMKEIVDLPIERFNERLAELNLGDDHVSLIRDIRRRGKNKIAARTCRKRKVDQISELQTVLDALNDKRDRAFSDLEESIYRRDLLKQKYQRLYRFIFPDHDPPEPVPSTAYFEEDSVVPPSRFPLCASATSRNETEHKKRGKHKGGDEK